ncbi:MAG: dihydroorotase [Candidatus Omnitrophica bacterium]|nr:dihydroorotase [Candidatus Omnitrophota bacterium]
MNLLIKNGRVIDPANGIDKLADILIKNGRIAQIGKNLKGKRRTIEAEGMLITPGLIDIHTHLREPGREDDETIGSGARAAIAGGFTTICVMPNTNPCIDDKTVVRFIYDRARETNLGNILPVAAITKERKGEELTEFGELVKAGAIGFSDDGNSIRNSRIMRRALEYAKIFTRPIIVHCEDTGLSAGGVINEGYLSANLGLPGIPKQAEEIIVGRDLMLAELTESRIHIAHLSTAGSVELIRQAKKKGIRVTCETCPQYFTLTESAAKDFDTKSKVNPPLREEKDLRAIKKGLLDGTIDVIASDHAPHSAEEKEKDFLAAPFGMIGLETTLPLSLALVDRRFPLSQMIAKLTINPAKILGIDKGTLGIGEEADITIINTKAEWTLKLENLKSKSKNTPFLGKKLKGKAIFTIVGGRSV